MNTISIDTNIYRGAEIYAQMHNISITELAEKALLKFVGKRESFRLKQEEELSPAVKSLIGIAKPSDKDEDINGREARMEFLSEKYGL